MPELPRLRLALPLGLLLLAGCVDDAPPAHLASVTDSAGVRVVQSAPHDESDVPRWAAQSPPLAEIGPHFLGGERDLGRLADLRWTEEGDLLLVNSGPPLFRIFSPGGSLRREVEGNAFSGTGPWPLRWMGRAPRGGVVLWSGTEPAVLTLSPDGSVRETRSVTLPQGAEAVGVLAGGEVLLRISQWSEGADAGEERVEFRLQTPDGIAGESLGSWPGRRAVRLGGRLEAAPFAMAPPVAIRADRVLLARPDGAILVYDRGGVLRERLETGVTGRTVTEADREAFLRLGLSELGPVGRERLEEMLAAVPPEAPLPAFDQLLVSPSGTVWARHTVTDFSQEVRWTLVDRRGHRAGEVVTPRGLVIRDVTDHRVVGSGYHPMGFEILRVHDLMDAATPPR